MDITERAVNPADLLFKRETPETATVSTLLSNYASAYVNSKFIAAGLCPEVEVEQIAGIFQKRNRYDVNETLSNDALASRGKANEINYSTTDDTYLLEGRAFRIVVNSVMKSGVASSMDREEAALRRVLNAIMLKHEQRVAGVFTTAGNYAGSNTFAAGTSRGGAATAWTAAGGIPVSDINKAKELIPFASEDDDIELVGGCSDVVANSIIENASVKGLFRVTDGQADFDQLASILRLAKVYVSPTTFSTSNPGQASPSFSRVWGSNTFVVAARPKVARSTEQQMFAASFRMGGMRVRKWFDPSEGIGGSDVIQVEHLTQAAKVIQNDSAVLITGT